MDWTAPWVRHETRGWFAAGPAHRAPAPLREDAVKRALGRNRARCRRRDCACPPVEPMRRLASFPIHNSNSAVFFVPAARCCARVLSFLFLAAFAEASAGMSAVALAAASRPDRGAEERREAVSSFRRARKARHHVARRGRPGQTGTGLAALHLAVLGPLRAVRPRSCLRLPLRGRPSLPGVAPGRPKVPNLPGTVYEPRPGRHSPLRLQDRLRRRPSMSEDEAI